MKAQVFAIGKTRKEAQELAWAGYYDETKAAADEIMRVKPSGVDSIYWSLLRVYKVDAPKETGEKSDG